VSPRQQQSAMQEGALRVLLTAHLSMLAVKPGGY